MQNKFAYVQEMCYICGRKNNTKKGVLLFVTLQRKQRINELYGNYLMFEKILSISFL